MIFIVKSTEQGVKRHPMRLALGCTKEKIGRRKTFQVAALFSVFFDSLKVAGFAIQLTRYPDDRKNGEAHRAPSS